MLSPSVSDTFHDISILFKSKITWKRSNGCSTILKMVKRDQKRSEFVGWCCLHQDTNKAPFQHNPPVATQGTL
jgi:hypothetical protein